jgi:hypothetical protein
MSIATVHIKEIQKELLQQIRSPVSKPMLHDLRVLIKKLQALWAIHPIGTGIAFRKYFPTTFQFFKTAAKARDLQMILQHLHTLPAFLKHKNLEKKLNKAILSKKKKFKKLQLRKKVMDKLSNEWHDLYQFFKFASSLLLKQKKKIFKEQTLSEIMHQSKSKHTALHGLRKKVKYMIFQSETLQSHYPGKEHNEDDFKDLQHQLGLWHDWYNVKKWVKHQVQCSGDQRFEDLLEQVERKEILLKLDAIKEIKIYALSLKKSKQKN